jgi:hypothetical protein
MKNEWVRVVIKKSVYFTLPAAVLLLIAVVLGAKLAIPLIIPLFAVCIAIPLVDIWSHFFPDFFHSPQWRTRPKPTFSMVRGMRKEQRFEAALEELRRMAGTDPQEVDIWIEMLEIALIDLHDKALGETVFRDAYSMLEKENDRLLIQRFYKNIVG